MSDVLSFDNEVFSWFVFCAAIVLAKVLFMSALTSTFRLLCGEYGSPEDYSCVLMPQASKDKKQPKQEFQLTYVERIRQAHRNDIENIIPFVLLGLLYVFTGPEPEMAKKCFFVFTGARVMHTVVYLLKFPQPLRATSFFVGFSVNAFLAYQILLKCVAVLPEVQKLMER